MTAVLLVSFWVNCESAERCVCVCVCVSDRWRKSAGNKAVGNVSSLGRSSINHQVHSPATLIVSVLLMLDRSFNWSFLARVALMPWCQSFCPSVCLWYLCTVFTGCDGSRISLHAWIDKCLYNLLTTPDPDRRMGWCRDFWWKRGGG